MLALPFYLAGIALLWLAIRPLRWLPALLWRGRCGVVTTQQAVASPLDGTTIAYCRWTIQRRLLPKGIDDEVSGETAASFFIDGSASDDLVDLNSTTLTLRPEGGNGWTAGWNGLTPAARGLVRSGFPEEEPDAQYHLSQITLKPGERVWITPDAAVLSDRSPSELARSMFWIVGLRVVVAGLLFWVGTTVAA